jgi:hypothetical protein
MLKLYSVAVIFACTLLSAHSGDTLDVPFGTRPVIDGVISVFEWDDADTVMTHVDSLPNGSVIVFYKENPDTLYMGILIPDVSYDAYDNASIYFDTLHNVGSTPQTDDFGCGSHRGGMFIEFVGDGTGWSTQPQFGWIGAINSTANGWSVEFAVSYTKLGLMPDVPKTLGFCTRIGDRFNAGVGWPPGVQRNAPNTWADMYSTWGVIGIEGKPAKIHNNRTIIHTNPSGTGVWFSNVPAGLINLAIYDILGKKIYDGQLVTKCSRFFWKSDLRSGIYFYTLKTDKEECKGKMIILK